MDRRTLIAGLVGGAFAADSGLGRAGSRSRLILMQPGIQARHPWLISHRKHVESLPFDGLMVHIPESWTVMTRERFSAPERLYEDWLAPYQTLWRRPMENWLRTFIDRPGDMFDENAWNVTIENWRDLARGAARAGFTGIAYDNEEYRGRWHDFPKDHPGAPAEDLPRYLERANELGRRTMEAIVSEFPNVQLLVLHGPYISEPATPDFVTRNQVASASHYELFGPFFVGLVQGAGSSSRVIDGGEIYQYRTPSDFSRSHDWRSKGMVSASTNSTFIPENVRADWTNRVSIGFGVTNQSWPHPKRDKMTPDIMEKTLTGALQRADDVVWFYTHKNNWLIPGKMPKDWVQAVRKARNKAS